MMAKKTVKEKEEDGYILIKGARVNNLKNIDVKIPRDKFVVITGLSGSGKYSTQKFLIKTPKIHRCYAVRLKLDSISCLLIENSFCI